MQSFVQSFLSRGVAKKRIPQESKTLCVALRMANETISQAAKKRAFARYPEVLVKAPQSGSHQQTFIFLHGRGSNATIFGPELLATPIPEFGSLPHAFPDAKFIFPTASKRRARIYKRMPIHQWFDNWSLETPEKWQELQNAGLRETSKFIHKLLRREIEAVGASNVVLGGLSQGCAASLVALLLWEGEALAAELGMCGWLPYRKVIAGLIRGEGTGSIGEGEDGGDDIFEQDATNEQIISHRKSQESKTGDAGGTMAATTRTDTPSIMQAIDFLREEIDLSTGGTTAPLPAKLKLQDIPLFLGHGTMDEKVPISLGRAAASCLDAMHVNVQWEEYDGLGHWYSGEMLRDIVTFLRTHTTWAVREENICNGMNH